MSRDIDVDVVVIDNSPDAGASVRSIVDLSVTVIGTGQNLGYAGGANRAIERWLRDCPDEQFVAITNHDCLLDPAALRSLFDVISNDDSVGAVGPGFVDGAGHWIGGTWDGRQAGMRLVGDDDFGAVVDAEWLKGECIVIRRTVLAAIGGFDERFGSYVEDVDFGLRVSDAGFRCVVCTDVTSRSVGSMASADVGFSLAARRRMIRRNQVFVAAKRQGVRGLRRSVQYVGLSATRTLAAAVMPGRTRCQRRESIAFTQVHVGVLIDLLRSRRVLVDLIREPDVGCELHVVSGD